MARERDELTNPSEPEERAHGAHGKGDAREQRVDDARVQPATREAAEQRRAGGPSTGDAAKDKLTSRLGDSAWGDAASGGSTIDKRPPDEE